MDTFSSFRDGLNRPLDGGAHAPSLLDLAANSQSLDWLWPGWIPRGMLTLLAAAPGVGKSLVALDLARRLLGGLPFPDDAPSPCPDPYVLYVDAEGPEVLLQRRAQAWGIVGDRLFLMQPQRWTSFDLTSADQLRRLGSLVRDLRPDLVIVDSLGAATPGGESGRKPLHILLTALPRLAEVGHSGFLLIHHLRKRTYSGRSAAAPVSLDDLRGSSHIAAVARSILALSPIPSPPAPGQILRPSAGRRLEVIKSNLAPLPPPLGLRLEDNGSGVPFLRYTGPILTPPPPATQLDLCAAWLLAELAAAAQPVRPADLIQAAVEAGFSRPTLHRARHLLGDQVLDLGTGTHDPTRRWVLASTGHAKPE